jgi:hypothetical protein
MLKTALESTGAVGPMFLEAQAQAQTFSRVVNGYIFEWVFYVQYQSRDTQK